MPDLFDDARRSLEGVPAPDLWGEAERRAVSGRVTELWSGGRPGHRRWLLAAAAAAVVAAVGVAVVAGPDDDGSRVDTNPATEAPTTSTVRAPEIVLDAVESDDDYEDGACWVGVTGDPVVMEAGPTDPPLFEHGSADPGQLVLHDQSDGLLVELSLPGEPVIDLMGEDVEDIELARGPAQLWTTADFAQVRWFPDDPGNDPCGSFTVTVAGGTPDEERATAVDYADRLLLSTDEP